MLFQCRAGLAGMPAAVVSGAMPIGQDDYPRSRRRALLPAPAGKVGDLAILVESPALHSAEFFRVY